MNEVEQPETSAKSGVLNFEFTGKGSEYFKIWTVNVLLSILTLGIYSAWAKVRRKRYFYGSLKLDGSSFEYHAEPIKILKGRIIVFVMYVTWAVLSRSMPVLGSLIFLVFSLLMPVIINRALRFNAVNSSYRNVRFSYSATYLETFINFIVYGFLSGLTLGLLYPFYVFNIKKHVIKHSKFGTKNFEFEGKVVSMYMIFIKTILVAICLFIGVYIIYSVTRAIGLVSVNDASQLAFTMFFILSIPVVLGYLRVSQANFIFSNVVIRESRFSSFMKPKRYIWILITNYLAIAVTLGVYIPFAIMRVMRYRYENLKVFVKGDVGEFVAAEAENIGAFGEEFDDFFDIDFGL